MTDEERAEAIEVLEAAAQWLWAGEHNMVGPRGELHERLVRLRDLVSREGVRG